MEQDQELPNNSGNFTKQTAEDQDLVSKLIFDFQQLFGIRGNWAQHWTEIAQRILPMESYLFQNYSQLNSMGDKRNYQLFDSTGLMALQRFGAILDSLLTPSDQIWHILRPDDELLMRDKASRLWFEQANNILMKERYETTANFQGNNQKCYTSYGAYGTGIMFTDALAGSKGIRYRSAHLGECYLQENHQGMIDSCCRHFMLTARQAVSQFGDNCPEMIKTRAKIAPETQYFFLHWVRPREDRDLDRKDYKGMPWASYYVSIECHALIYEGGYRTFPYSVGRYYQAANETYGRSPAMDVLPALKTLNEMKKSQLKQAHRAIDPVLIAHDDGILDGFSLEPGNLNFGGVTADGKPTVQVLPTGNFQVTKEAMQEERSLVNDTFLVNLFQILTENPQMTATEVLERTREKGILLAPTVGRIHSEAHGPMIERELDILSFQGKLPPQPKLLKSAKGKYKIQYDSPIARTQKSAWASGAMRTIEAFAEYAQATGNPEPLDIIDIDKAGPAIARINGVPESWIRDVKDIQKIRQNRAQQANIQQQIQAAPAVAGLAKAGVLPGQNNK